MGLSWLTQADNVNITSADKIVRRDGYDLDIAGEILGAYATIDHQRLFFVDGTSLKSYDHGALASITSRARMHWTEVNNQVFFNNGVDRGSSRPTTGSSPWTGPCRPPRCCLPCRDPWRRAATRSWCTYLLPDGRETGAGQSASIDIEQGQAFADPDIPRPRAW